MNVRSTTMPVTPAVLRREGERRPIRVALISDNGKLTAAQQSLLRLAIGLARRPDFRPLLLLSEAGPLAQRCRDYGIEVAVTSAPDTRRSGSPRLRKILSRPRAGIRLLSRLRRFSPDLIYSNSARQPAGALAARLLGVGHVWHLYESPQKPVSGLAALLTRALLASSSTRIVCNSDATRIELARRIKRNDLARVYCGLDFPRVPQVRGRDLHAQRVGRGTTWINLLFDGGELAALGTALDALDRLIGLDEVAGPISVRIFCVQCAHRKPAVQQLLRDRAAEGRARVYCTDEAVDALDDCAALTLICGSGEHLIQAAIASLAVGIPVCAPDSGAVPEVIQHGRTGICYGAQEADSLVHELRRLLGDPERYGVMSATAIDACRQRFPARRNVRELAEILRRTAIAQRPRLRTECHSSVTALGRDSINGRSS